MIPYQLSINDYQNSQKEILVNLHISGESFLILSWMLMFDTQDESQDFIKRQQLRELALLNSNFREESPGPSGSVSPFNSSGMKRAKPGR
jgi:hypothetical protein